MSGDKKPPIIKKVIKKGHGGHHGGSWKVAYADFVTAMMAFFLVMWLLAISSEAGREALADYFNQLTLTEAIFNGGMPSAFTEGGATNPSVLEGGCFSPRQDGDATIDPETQSEAMKAQMAALLATTQTLLQNLDSLPEGTDGGEGSGDVGRYDTPPPLTAQEQEFSDQLMHEVQSNLGSEAASQVMVENVKGGLRIQIVDHDGHPMFRSSGAGLTDEAKAILDVVAQRLLQIPNKISIEGHTDALSFAGQRMTNWELSTARASAARLYLSQQGIEDSRVTMVSGFAATQPLPKTSPNDPINRRLSIMIWDDGSPASSSGAAAESPKGADNSAQGDKKTTLTPPPLPKTPPKVQGDRHKAVTNEELERQLIDETMDEAATPDLSTVGPADYSKLPH